MAIPKDIKPLGEYDKWIRALIVADSGFGKTVFCGTAPKALFLTTDPEGTISAKAFGSTAREWKIESWTMFNDAYRYLRDGGIEELGLEFLIIDNVSESQNLAMQETMEIARSHNKKLDEFISSQQDYLRSQNMLRTFVKRFNDLPVNVIWTAWQNKEEDDEGDRYYAPGVHGQKGMLAQTVAGYMNIVGYGEVLDQKDANGNGIRRIWFSQTGPYRGKDRFQILGEYRDKLDVPKMYKLITDQVAKISGPAKRPATSRVASKTATPIKKAPIRRATTTPRKKA